MNFELEDRHKLVRRSVRTFAEKLLGPLASIMDREEEFYPEVIKELSKMNLWGIKIPEKYGGAELDTISYLISIEEISRICASTALAVSVHNGIGALSINRWGNEELKDKYLRELALGEKIAAFSWTEPNAGSDARSIETMAVDDGKDFVLNGSKIFVTNGGIASIFLVGTRFQTTDGSKGFTILIVEKDMEGCEIGLKENKLGMRGNPTRSLYFNNVHVPKENVLGNLQDGFKYAMQMLDVGRIGIAAQALGIAQAAYEHSVEYSKGRIQFKKPIAQFQGISFKLAEMATNIDAARLMLYKAGHMYERNVNFSKEAAMCKLFASKIARQVSQEALQIHGGYGYMKDLPIERYYRDAKACEIYEGTSEVMKLIISNQILKGNI
ncbi:MAG: acyl-CoA dehydrogenase family protein [Promethearchaeota archaeon]